MDENNNIPQQPEQQPVAPQPPVAPQQPYGAAPQQPYMAPQQPYAPQQPNPGKGKSIAALVMGIISVALYWIPYFNIILLVLGILAIVMGVKGRNECPIGSANGRGLATAGLVLGIIGTVFAGIGVFTCTLPAICACGAASSSLDALGDLARYY